MEPANNPSQPSPDMIMKIGTGFFGSKVLLSAVKFGLFTMLSQNGKMSMGEIKAALGFKCTDRHVFDFLDTLTTFGFLKRDGLLESAVYSNGQETEIFLDKAKPSYIGGILEMANNRLYEFWGNLEDGLMTGLPQNEIKHGEEHLFAELYKNPEKLHEFIHAMSGVQMGNFMMFAQNFDFSKYKTLVDVGGSGAILSIMVAKHQPGMSCISFDLPPVAPIAQENINKYGLSDAVKTASGDFFADPIPKADVVVMGNILHDWDEERKITLMKAAYDALPEGGAFVAIEGIIDENRNQNVFGMLMSLNMLIETGKGFDYTFADFNKWANIAGFNRTELLPLAGPSSAAIAYK
jgi:hypothetical protein